MVVGKFGCQCGYRWSGMGECHCSGCHEHFRSLSGFSKHDSVAGCVDPRKIRGLEHTSEGVWVRERTGESHWALRGSVFDPDSPVTRGIGD